MSTNMKKIVIVVLQNVIIFGITIQIQQHVIRFAINKNQAVLQLNMKEM